MMTDHTDAALALGELDYEEHIQGSKECYEEMMQRPLVVKCYVNSAENKKNKMKTNTKLVHFVRHGQGFHNLMADLAKEAGRTWKQCTNDPANPYIMPEILDAPLTHKGREQAIALQSTVRALDESEQPQLVVLSPHCRALQTGVLAFEELLDGNRNDSNGNKKCSFIAHEMVREETGVHRCDQRRPKSRQEKEFPMVDFSLLTDEDDKIFDPNRRESKLEVSERIYTFMEWLEKRPENVVGVASHSAWLLTTFNANLDIIATDEDDAKSLKDWFQTGEIRSVILEFVRT